MGKVDKRLQIFSMFCVIFLSSLSEGSSELDHPERVPAADFFRFPVCTSADLSPDGKRVAYLGRLEDQQSLFITDLQSGETYAAWAENNLDVYRYHWADSDHLIFNVSKFEQWDTGLFCIDREVKTMKRLASGRLVRVIGGTEDDTPGVVVAARVPPKGDYHAYSLDYLEANKYNDFERISDRVAKDPGKILGWLCDLSGNVRFGAAPRMDSETGKPEIYWMGSDKKGKVWSEYSLPDDTVPAAFDYDGQTLYVFSASERNTSALYEFDSKVGELGKLLVADERFDVNWGTLRFSSNRRRLVGLTYDRTRTTSIWIDPVYRDLQEAIDKIFPDTVNVIIDQSQGGTLFLTHAFSDRNPGQYFIIDVESFGVSKLCDSRPWIDSAKMAPTKGITFETRDGIALHGYITLPLMLKSSPYPTVVLVHGGPFARDVWGFNSEVQFYANRGYAVLQVNYRGSTGYGKEYMEAAKGEFGHRIQNDITDAVQGAIGMEIADPNRIAIVGASFGAYIAICALEATPNLYACAVAFAGVYDWERHLKQVAKQERWYREDFSFETWSYWLTSPGDAFPEVYSSSPINFVDRIKAPVFVIHGMEDTVVEAKQSKLLLSALKKHNKEFKTLFDTWEGHGFRDEEKRIDLYRKIEEFLGEHM